MRGRRRSTRARLRSGDRREIWRRIEAGEPTPVIAAAVGCSPATISGLLRRASGLRPPDSRGPRAQSPSGQRLSFVEREEISRGVQADELLRRIAARLGRATSTISRGGPQRRPLGRPCVADGRRHAAARASPEAGQAGRQPTATSPRVHPSLEQCRAAPDLRVDLVVDVEVLEPREGHAGDLATAIHRLLENVGPSDLVLRDGWITARRLTGCQASMGLGNGAHCQGP